MKKKLIVIIGAFPDSLINFRGPLIKKISEKHNVLAMSGEGEPTVKKILNSIDVDFQSFPVQRNGINPIVDSKTLFFLKQFFQTLKPNIVFAYTIKPVIWGGIACKFTPNIRFFALITGLGFAFQGGSITRDLLSKLVAILYRSSLKNAEKVIFQNKDNLHEFVSRKIVPKEKCTLVNGSGVDVQHFYHHTPLPTGSPVFLMMGRLVGEKGFREFAQAAEIVKEKYPDTIFQILGLKDSSQDAIPDIELQHWQQQGWVENLGWSNDVPPYLQRCHIYVLPSYHEGMPRSVLEAMSTGRPILTTDVPGCRETVIQGENGFLIPKADSKALAERMVWLINHRDQWNKMGEKSREIAEKVYDVNKVNEALMKIMDL